jgi:hypothetical protein
LQGGPQKIEELRQRFYDLGGGMSKDFIDKAKEAGRAMGGVKMGLSAFKRAIAYEAFPYLTMWCQRLGGVVTVTRA